MAATPDAAGPRITAKPPRGRNPGKLPHRQNATHGGVLVNPPRYRDLAPGEWFPCPCCKVAHGGYCLPWDGATVADWTDSAPAKLGQPEAVAPDPLSRSPALHRPHRRAGRARPPPQLSRSKFQCRTSSRPKRHDRANRTPIYPATGWPWHEARHCCNRHAKHRRSCGAV